MKKDGIKVDGHRGTFYIIDEEVHKKYGKVYLLESEMWGEDANHVIVNKHLQYICNSRNGFSELDELEY